MDWTIPLASGDVPNLVINLDEADRLFIVGANGSGKSALIQHFISSHPGEEIRRISAHRQTWIQSASLELSPLARQSVEQNVLKRESRDDARWLDHGASERLSAVLFDLVAGENSRARSITNYLDRDEDGQAKELARASTSLFLQLNELLTLGTLTISLENSNDVAILARHRDETLFSIAKLSDGERNAIILAATVLTVKPGTVLLIDEPERHLHRSIIEPFLSALFECRLDCPFVVSTHEIALPATNPRSRVLMPRSCEWNGDSPRGWDIQILEPNNSLPEDLKLAILGSRRRILFVEGTLSSLDLPLYSALFPGLSVVAKEGCADVQRAVAGLRGAFEHHHVEAHGLIDRDDRSAENIEELAAAGVFALDVHSAEALYYGSDALAAVARRQAESLGKDADEMIAGAKSAAIDALKKEGVSERMAARRCGRRLRDDVMSMIPDWKSIRDSGDAAVELSVTSSYPDEVDRLRQLLEAADWYQLLCRYPIRESEAFDRVARCLQCGSRRNYEQMVISRLNNEEDLSIRLRAQVGPLSRALGAAVEPQAQIAK